MDDALTLSTEAEVLALDTAATPPGFWPAKLGLCEQSKLYRRHRATILGAISRDLAHINRIKESHHE